MSAPTVVVFDDPGSARYCGSASHAGSPVPATKHVVGSGVDAYLCERHAAEVERPEPAARGDRCDECGRPSIGPLCSTHRRLEDGPYDEDDR